MSSLPANLMEDLTELLRCRGAAEKLIYNLASAAVPSRQAAWDTHGAPVFKAIIRKRPGQRREAHRVEQRLKSVMFTDEAAGTPSRLLNLLNLPPKA